MDNLTARIKELNWVLRRIQKAWVADDELEDVELDIVGRLLALENEAIAKEVTNNGGR